MKVEMPSRVVRVTFIDGRTQKVPANSYAEAAAKLNIPLGTISRFKYEFRKVSVRT